MPSPRAGRHNRAGESFGGADRPYVSVTARGIDVDDHGDGTLTEHRLHQLIRQPKPIADRLFNIEFLAAGVEAFALMFG